MFKELKKRVDKFSDMVYYEPMTEKEIVDFEEKVGKPLNSVYRMFLSTFGLVQDLLADVNTSQDSILENVAYLKDKLPDYFPIFADIDEFDTIYLMSTTNLESNQIYKVRDNNEKFGEIEAYTTLPDLLTVLVQEMESGEAERCSNSEKVHNYEYSFEMECSDDFNKKFNSDEVRQLSEWSPKYYPDNIFGDELADFIFRGCCFRILRDDEGKKYRFEFDESILIKEKDSIAYHMDNLLDKLEVSYNKVVVKLLEI